MKRPRPFHPFLFALFPILALYAYNIRSIPLSSGELAGPVLGSLFGTGLLFLAFSAALRAPAKAGIAASIVVLWFLSFGHLAGWLSVWTGGLFTRSLFWGTACLVAVAVVLVGRGRRDLGPLTRVLNVVAATLVLWNLFSIVQTVARRPHASPGGPVPAATGARSRPNIYYLIFDAYTRGDVLQEVFSSDNSGFLAALRARGFFIAEQSYANYCETDLSLASSLNFILLEQLAGKMNPLSGDRTPLYEMIRNNQAVAFLRSQGYRILTVSSSFEPTDLHHVDRYFGFAKSDSEFRQVLLATTPLALVPGMIGNPATLEAHRRRILSAFQALEGSPAEKGPFFMFAHIMAPHPPFVFGANGEALDTDTIFSILDGDRLHGGDEAAVRAYLTGYRNQLAFLNTKILDAVGAILEKSAEPPIIVLQGDHGSRAYMDFDHPEASYFKENLAILNAYFLPRSAPGFVYPRISPVNTFRGIFRTYFGADLEALPDRSAWTAWRHPYRFIPFDPDASSSTLQSVRLRRKLKDP